MGTTQKGSLKKNSVLEPWPVIKHRPLVRGKLHRPAIGLIELSTEVIMSSEIKAFLPDCNYGIYTSRVEFGDNADVEGLAEMESHINTAANLLPDTQFLDAIVFGCTSGSMVIGPERLNSLISSARPDVPVFNPVSAAIAAFQSMNRKRIAIVTPYPHETNRIVSSFLRERGIVITNALTFDILSGYDMSRLNPDDIYAGALQVNTDEAEAIFISCTALCVSPVLEAIEQKTGKPVVTSNQALTWQCCEIVGLQRTDGHSGELFNYRLEMDP